MTITQQPSLLHLLRSPRLAPHFRARSLHLFRLDLLPTVVTPSPVLPPEEIPKTCGRNSGEEKVTESDDVGFPIDVRTPLGSVDQGTRQSCRVAQ